MRDVRAGAGVTSRSHSFDGTAGRNIIDGPGSKNVDMGIFRAFRVTESKSLQFRAESTDAFNLVNLSNPGTNAGSPSTLEDYDGGRDAAGADGFETGVLWRAGAVLFGIFALSH